MNKKKAISLLLVLILAIAGLSYVTACGIGEEKAGAAQNIKLGLDLAGGVSITYQVVGDETPSPEDMSDTVYKLQKRVENYSTEAQVYQEGDRRVNIEIPGVTNADEILAELGNPGTLYFIAQTDANGEQNYGMGAAEDGTVKYILNPNKTIESLKEEGSIVLDGTQVQSAQATQQTSNSGTREKEYVVQLSFNDEGAKAFADATAKAYSAGESIGIYYDGEFISVPNVQAVIADGSAVITGMENFEAASNLASSIRIGGLSRELEVLQYNIVGAQLGSQAINTSLTAAMIGFVIVALFMIIIYWIPGLASVIALAAYVVLELLLLLGFNITLTLPGIAGIILSIGMAVDANVIIFARIREEIATGKSVKSAIKIGYEKALSAIIDGNVTTVLAALVLMVKGTGPVKGFAQTLLLGIVLSMITALFVTKFIMNAFYAAGLKDEKFYGKAKETKEISFVSKKPVFFGLSVVLIAAGFVFMGVNASSTGDILNYSLEFKGGTSTTVEFAEDMSIERLEAEVIPAIEAATGETAVSSKVRDTNQVIFKTGTLSPDMKAAFDAVMSEQFGVSENQIQAESISSTISNEMKGDSVVAVIISVILMLIYIWFRFKDIRFGAAAVLCLCHDVLVVLAFYAAARVTVGNTFIACMLTIVGYSINATIVVFDRVRENMRLAGSKEELDAIVNKSVTQTLSRSIFTSLTTFVMVAALYVLGVTAIREFALPLMVGIICGTYSSVCVAGSLWFVFKTKFAKKASK